MDAPPANSPAMIPGFLFLSWRIAELIFVVPIVGMLGWFVSGYNSANMLTPTSILVLFIVSCLALGWVFFTILGYSTAKHSGYFLCFIDLCFVGAFIAGVYYLRGITGTSCGHFTDSNFWLNLGVFGYYGAATGNSHAKDPKQNCSMLKASFAFGIMEIIFFFVTALLALWVHHHHRHDYDKRTVTTTRRVSRHRSGSRSGGYTSGSPRRSHHSQRSRRNYYV